MHVADSCGQRTRCVGRENDGFQHQKVCHFTQSFSWMEIEMVRTFTNENWAFVNTIYHKEVLRWCILLDRKVIVNRLHRTFSTGKEMPSSRRWYPWLELLIAMKVGQRSNSTNSNIRHRAAFCGPYHFTTLLQPLCEELDICRKPRLHVWNASFVLGEIPGIHDKTPDKLCEVHLLLLFQERIQNRFM